LRRASCVVVAIGAWAVLASACGESQQQQQPAATPAKKSAGVQFEAEVLGARFNKKVPLRLCDRRRVEVVRVRGDEAIEAWRKLRGEADASGRWPVLVGPPEDASFLADVARFNCKAHPFEATLERAAEVSVERAIARVARIYGVRDRDLRGSKPLPDQPPGDDFVVPTDLATGEPLPEVWIALLPIDQGWKAPAILPWGDWNDSPPPAVHTAVLREWNRRYGAELVAMTGDILELSVARPPTTDEAALALAREQYSYAPDIVQQGVEDVETLAALLKNGHAWYFWWD